MVRVRFWGEWGRREVVVVVVGVRRWGDKDGGVQINGTQSFGISTP